MNLSKLMAANDATAPRGDDLVRAAWNRLQCLSCAHSALLWQKRGRQTSGYFRRSISVPDVIEENCRILGRGDESEIKYRVLWYLTYYPDLFDTCSKDWNRLV